MDIKLEGTQPDGTKVTVEASDVGTLTELQWIAGDFYKALRDNGKNKPEDSND